MAIPSIMSKHKPDKARLESKDQAHAAIETPPVKLIQKGGHMIPTAVSMSQPPPDLTTANVREFSETDDEKSENLRYYA
ncbi:hypothetical protein F2Q70_00020077 [Brassica cretica]|uniref:Uncharacterized protein n=1 Tax=Brassica cretica TaxID=69181 RepID=A0A3N6S4U9_BRACR|nr:hypothetical protein F2Q70_00020077 [Brassica cretica]KAF3609269.1 hypothetical protein DY000_02045619 [Brassica cretica]